MARSQVALAPIAWLAPSDEEKDAQKQHEGRICTRKSIPVHRAKAKATTKTFARIVTPAGECQNDRSLRFEANRRLRAGR